MSGNSSCTRNIIVALNFAFDTPETKEPKSWIPVLFVLSCQNYEAFPGFRLNNLCYTSYPCEEEVLLSEGCPAIILEVESNFKITSRNDIFAEFKDKPMTVIHLYLPDYNVNRLRKLEKESQSKLNS